MTKGVKQIRWDLSQLVEQVRTACAVDENGCWLWQRGKRPREWYPEIMIKRRRQSVARWVLEATTGITGEVARHQCDRMSCCNPDHLLWGSTLDNVRDRVARGRGATGDRNSFRKYPDLYRGENHWARRYPERIRRGADHPWTGKPNSAMAGDGNPSRRHPERLPRGESHWKAKLTNEAVADIRERRAQGVSMYRLSKEYSVSKATIRQVVTRKTWRHLP